MATASREFIARWAFLCACCGVEQPEGTTAQYGRDGLLRSVEPDHTPDQEFAVILPTQDGTSKTPAVMPHGKTAADRCDRCFIVHSPGQEDCY